MRLVPSCEAALWWWLRFKAGRAFYPKRSPVFFRLFKLFVFGRKGEGWQAHYLLSFHLNSAFNLPLWIQTDERTAKHSSRAVPHCQGSLLSGGKKKTQTISHFLCFQSIGWMLPNCFFLGMDLIYSSYLSLRFMMFLGQLIPWLGAGTQHLLDIPNDSFPLSSHRSPLLNF